MKTFRLTNKAVEDLDSIWNYTCEEWSENQADKYYQDLIESIKSITILPMFLDKNHDDILLGLYSHRCGKHLIFYRLVDDCVEVIRILHERMDAKSKL